METHKKKFKITLKCLEKRNNDKSHFLTKLFFYIVQMKKRREEKKNPISSKFYVTVTK